MNAISTHFPCFPHLDALYPSNYVSNTTIEKIRSVAHSAITELAAALTLNIAFNVAFGYFMLPISAHLMTDLCKKALMAVGAMQIVKLWKACFPQTLNPNQETEKNPINFFTRIENGSRSLARLSIVNTATLKLSHYIHEFGHAGAALLCYLKADPDIIVRWYEGLTEYNISYGLTKFGEFLGEHYRLLFVTSAGLFTPVLCAMTEFAVAHHIHEKHPLISEMLNCHGISQILNLALYGYHAFIVPKSMLQNDFIFLWVMGDINPLIPISLIVAIPLCELIYFSGVINKYLKPKAKAMPT